ncbi:DUF6538 domain-containing protein [Pseudomonas sp. D(2018)]|uniref:DUF6538 domain-containing protein n=1 Tax=Pseudomonas sp. D(2018) TaxID=2502238 RepID=UPI0010F898F8|nr:DUF6538 domain-containing protein [Pseudomonas sp. D(2018)]
MADNLERQGGIYHVRLAVPKDVQPAFGNRRILSKSLGTSNRAEALRLRLPYLVQWKAEFQSAREDDTLSQEDKDAALHKTQHLAKLFDEIAQRGTLAALKVKPVNYSQIEGAAMLPASDLADLEALTDAGDAQGVIRFVESSRAQLLNFIMESDKTGVEAQEATDILSGTYKPRSPITKNLLQDFRAYYEKQGKTPKTTDVLIRKIEMFSDFLGKTGSALDFDTVVKYLDQLTDAKGTPLSAKTKKQHIWACNSFWKWACKYSASWRETYKGTPNPFAEHDLPIVKGESISYKAFGREQVEALHANARTAGDRNLANLIALGAYTGCRLEELGRIDRDSITFEGNTPISFAIADAKTKAGIREVPLHSRVVPLVLQLLEKSKDGFLLEGRPLDHSNKYGNRLDAVGKRFGRLKTAAGFNREFVFHSVRKTAITECHQAGGDIATMPALFGHETGLITLDIYSAGPSMEQKSKVIELLDFTFDFTQ